MKSDKNGASTCPIGQEQYEEFRSLTGDRLIQYDYRADNGELFSCCAPTLQSCRDKRDAWLLDLVDPYNRL